MEEYSLSDIELVVAASDVGIACHVFALRFCC